MKINRIAEEKLAPSWAFEDLDNISPSEFINNEYITSEEIARIESLPLVNLTEEDIIVQRERIELSVKNDSLYHYNSKWNADVKSTLKEYAIVCGMNMAKFKAVHPEYIESIKVIGKEVENFKTLSNKEQKDFFKKANKGEITMLEDPFKINEKADMSHMEKANWEDNKKQDNLDLRPSMKGGIIPIRGGEDYNKSPETRTARGQNSIGNENAIENLIENEQEDTGARLKRENEERRDTMAKHQEWEKEKIEAMGDTTIVPKGNVFPTETMNAQPGIKGNGPFDLDSIPEKTKGEKIAEVNEDRKKEIRGGDKEKFEFNLRKAPIRGISDLFGEELKKAFGYEDN